MAVRRIAFPIVFKKNDNQYSQTYGKYYPEAYRPATLSLSGLIERVAFEQSVYSRDIVRGVIEKVTKVMVELIEGGQPVKWDGLGTFTPYTESVKNGASAQQLVDPNFTGADYVKGIHIRFIPENEKGEELTSVKFKDLCVIETKGVLQKTVYGEGAAAKKFFKLLTINEFKENLEPQP